MLNVLCSLRNTFGFFRAPRSGDFVTTLTLRLQRVKSLSRKAPRLGAKLGGRCKVLLREIRPVSTSPAAMFKKSSVEPAPREVADPNSVVVIGSGIAGLAAAWLLTKQGKKITLLEAEDRLGGHALTVDTEVAGPIDLGFQVCNLTNYPHLFGFFDALGVDTVESDMSFALSTPGARRRTPLGRIATPGSASARGWLAARGAAATCPAPS